jgi:hypothetical protein
LLADLSNYHAPLGGLFEMPKHAEDWERYRLSDEPLLEGVPAIKRGEVIGGQFFPLLFDPRSVGLQLSATKT